MMATFTEIWCTTAGFDADSIDPYDLTYIVTVSVNGIENSDLTVSLEDSY